VRELELYYIPENWLNERERNSLKEDQRIR
jgi:hypothetical protein